MNSILEIVNKFNEECCLFNSEITIEIMLLELKRSQHRLIKKNNFKYLSKIKNFKNKNFIIKE